MPRRDITVVSSPSLITLYYEGGERAGKHGLQRLHVNPGDVGAVRAALLKAEVQAAILYEQRDLNRWLRKHGVKV